MAGILPEGGVPALDAFNTLPNADIKEGCDSLWHARRCVPRFDPDSANAVISEIINAVNAAGLEYDCSVLDNLANALAVHEISGNFSALFDNGSPVPIESGNERKVGSGKFVIPNSYHRPINVAVYIDATMQWNLDGGDDTSALVVNWKFNGTNDFDGVNANITQRISYADKSQVVNPVYFRVFTIPPGGRTFFWEARSTTTGPGSWDLPYTATAIAVRCYGVNSATRDDLAVANIGN